MADAPRKPVLSPAISALIRALARQAGYAVVERYSDAAISGQTLDQRLGFSAMMQEPSRRASLPSHREVNNG